MVGTVTGTLKDVEEALDFTARGLVKPILVTGTINDINTFVDKMLAGQLPGRAVINLWA